MQTSVEQILVKALLSKSDVAELLETFVVRYFDLTYQFKVQNTALRIIFNKSLVLYEQILFNQIQINQVLINKILTFRDKDSCYRNITLCVFNFQKLYERNLFIMSSYYY